MSADRSRRNHSFALVGAFAVPAATDPGSTRLVYAMVAGLAVVGVAFILLGVWLIRHTRVDLPVLAPLERMGDRDWKRKDAPTQRRLLDEIRPDGAVPLHAEPQPPVPDAEFGQPLPPATFADLGPGLVEQPEPSAQSDSDDEPDPEPEPDTDTDSEPEPESAAEPGDQESVEESVADSPEDESKPAPGISW